VLMHEMGHVLGYEHEEDGVMQELLPAGTRWDLVGDWLGDMDWLGVAWAVTSKSANNR